MDNTKDLGLCPKCGKGHIIEHPFGWSCNNSEKQPDGTWKGAEWKTADGAVEIKVDMPCYAFAVFRISK